MHDEDENGGGNTSSSQPDNIGVANEDDGNDVDVVKPMGNSARRGRTGSYRT